MSQIFTKMEVKKNKDEKKISILLEDLAALEGYTRDLFSFLPLPVCFISSIGVILEVNPAFEKISGYKIDEIIGRSAEDIFGKEGLKRLLKDAQEKGFIRAREATIFTKERKKIPISSSVTLRKGKGEEITGYFIGFFDLTDVKIYQRDLEEKSKGLESSRTALINLLEDTKEAQGLAEEEKSKTSAIIANFTDGLLVLDTENRLSLINPQAEDFFNIKTKDVVGQPISELVTSSTLKPLIKLLGKRTEKLFRKELSLKGPKEKTLEVTTVPIFREGKEPETLVILHDISREKIVERMKTEFVSLSAHQLRTPLSAIKWTLKMLLDGDLGEITEEQRNFIQKTYQSNERMISLINDLLDITRIEEGKILYKPTFDQIEDIAQFVINSFDEQIKKRKIKLEFKKPKEKLPKVKVDVEKIRVAISNFLDNAIRYTPVGGRVTVYLKRVKNEVELSVEDTGVGILKDQQKRIFTKFFRGANAVRMETEGSGLGLFIAKNIIEAHKGKTWFKSEKGKGTTFYLALPIPEKFKEFLKGF